jgi:hypothetical protein
MQISEKTLLPISLVITIIGGVIWLSVMYQKVEAHQISLQQVEIKQDTFEADVIDRLARIETLLNGLRPQKGE